MMKIFIPIAGHVINHIFTVKKFKNRIMKTININDFVYIHITAEGWKYLRRVYTEKCIRFYIDENYIKINERDYYRLPLWQVFNFLPQGHGKNLLFEANFLIEEKNIVQ